MAQVLVLVQRVDRRTRRRSIIVSNDFELPAFAFEDDPLPDPAEGDVVETDFAAAPPTAAEALTPTVAYITVTDAAGRVLFRRQATAQEISDAMRSADEATREGEAAMERIAYDRMFEEILGDGA